jgi:hypothetical protein
MPMLTMFLDEKLAFSCKKFNTSLSYKGQNVKVTPEQAMKAQRRSKGIALLFL